VLSWRAGTLGEDTSRGEGKDGCNCQPKRSDGDPADCLETQPTTWLDLWSIARYDLDLGWEEFSDLTPAMFQALCIRRNVRIRYERFANALTAASVYNVHRATDDSPIISAFDFVREPDPDREQTQQIKRLIKNVVGSMPAGSAREKYLEVRERTIASLVTQGRTDAEAIFDQCWPSLKGK
jgi:hypothetical protein